MARKIQIIILCEDEQQSVFLRWFLIGKGFSKRKIRVNKSPRGKGSGEQFVREQFPVEVRVLRSKNYMNLALITVVDADALLVDDRKKQLMDGLKQRNIQAIGQDEAIVLVIPKRNIETWLHWLENDQADEVQVYPKLNRPAQCKNNVKKLSEFNALPENAPPSLKTFWRDFSRIDDRLPRS